MSNPPFSNESAEQYMERCASLAGERLPRATPEQIDALKAKGYFIQRDSLPAESIPADPEMGFNGLEIEAQTLYAWMHIGSCEFQDTEPSYTEEDAWALALQHSQEQE